jgi:uncharacterized protein YbjT (DUF2867 family)
MRILLFGATGTAGSGVLRACLQHPALIELRVVGRRPLAMIDSRVQTFVHDDYLRFDDLDAAFRDVDACFWCLGISVQQVADEAEYRRITHDFAVAAARQLKASSPRAVFHYLSGEGANTESRFMWARVKAETERELAALTPTVCWRPAYIDGGDAQRGPVLYRMIRPVFSVFGFIRSIYVTSEDIGRAMLQATLDGRRSGIIVNREIRALADRARGAAAAPLRSA